MAYTKDASQLHSMHRLSTTQRFNSSYRCRSNLDGSKCITV